MKKIFLTIIMLGLFFSIDAFAQEEKSESNENELQSDEDLAKAVQNPVANLISLPFQNNTNFGFGPYNRTQNVLNIQPVIPFGISENWNLITRTIVPVITQPNFTSENGSTTGLGDINFSAFLSPKAPGKIIWGVGPAIILPSATETNMGSGKWSAGPSAVALTMSGPWVAGLIMSNVWSFAGQSNRDDVNFFFAQYFVNYNMDHGWYLVSAPIITANWEAASGEQWIVPFGAGGGKILKLGNQPININMQAFYNAVSPDFGPDWQFRFQLQFMFPQ